MNSFGKISVALTLILAAAGCAERPGQYSQYGQTASYADQVISSPREIDSGALTSSSDSALAEQVQQNLARNNLGTASRNLNVAVKDGNVTLTGTVPGETTRRQIDDVVRNTPGVTAVLR